MHPWVRGIVVLCLAVFVTVPAWAARQCCCTRKRSLAEKSCCHEIPADLPPCCRAKLDAQKSMESDAPCQCKHGLDPAATPQLIRSEVSLPVSWLSLPFSDAILDEQVLNTVTADVRRDRPPPWAAPPPMIQFCRWLT